MRFADALSRIMHQIMAQHDHAIVMGQGAHDPVGILGTTKGLREEFGEDRVYDTPIAEEGMTGVAVGAALSGLYPIQTHIRNDFLLLAMNQLINLAAIYQYTYGGSMKVPMLVRSIIGRSWGQGPQHSKSLQALFGHIPGLKVIMPSSIRDLYNSYHHAVTHWQGPVISLEHRFLYDTLFEDDDLAASPETPAPATLLTTGRDVTVVATSYMVQEAQRALKWMGGRSQIEVELIGLTDVSDIDHEMIFASVQKTGRLLIADTSWLAYGVNAEVSRGIVARDPSVLKKAVIQVGLAPVPTPTSHALESTFYPDLGDIAAGIFQLTDQSDSDLPSEEYKRSQRDKFKGPF